MTNLAIYVNLEQELEKANAEYNNQKEETIKQARQLVKQNTITYGEAIQTINELIKLLEGEF